jgi:hypothetical protein
LFLRPAQFMGPAVKGFADTHRPMGDSLRLWLHVGAVNSDGRLGARLANRPLTLSLAGQRSARPLTAGPGTASGRGLRRSGVTNLCGS